MAEVRRKSVKGYKRVDCMVPPDCYAVLDRYAGDHGIGYAIERICAIVGVILPIENRPKQHGEKKVIRRST